MKCNLSQVWKREIDSIERAKERRREERVAAENKRVFEALVADLKNQEWVFVEEERTDHHKNDTNIDHKFKSPRMKSFSTYYPRAHPCLLTAEAAHLGRAAFAELSARTTNLFIQYLTEYYLHNPTATNIPEIKMTLTTPTQQ
jgi:hypothetical protein